MKVIRSLIILVLLMTTFVGHAQNVMTSSPYSMFGIGEIVSGLYNSNAAMGGLAVGLRNSTLINTDNPAALTALDSCRLFAEASVFAKWESYGSKGSGNQAFTGNLSRFTLAGRIIPRWYMAVGVTPYSSVGYYFQSSQELEGSPGSYYISTFSGDGGFSKLFLSNAFLISKHLSVGVNMNYIFGNITQGESQSTMSITKKLSGKAFTADFGLQYERQLGRELYLTAGAVYGLSAEISMENTKTIIENSTSSSSNQRRVRQQLPDYMGAGASLKYKKMTYGMDYMLHTYSSLTSDDSRFTFHDSHELRTGACFSPGGYSSQSILKRMHYKLGFGLSMPYYMKIRGESGIQWRVNAGLGFPLTNGKLNVALFYDHVKAGNNMFTRSTTGLSLTYTLSELFFKVKL